MVQPGLDLASNRGERGLVQMNGLGGTENLGNVGPDMGLSLAQELLDILLVLVPAADDNFGVIKVRSATEAVGKFILDHGDLHVFLRHGRRNRLLVAGARRVGRKEHEEAGDGKAKASRLPFRA